MLCNALRPPGLNARRTSSFAPRLRPEPHLSRTGLHPLAHTKRGHREATVELPPFNRTQGYCD